MLKIPDAKKLPKIAIVQLCRAISSQLRHVSTIGKNLLSSNMSSAQYGVLRPLAAEIGSVVSGVSANFNGFHVMAALLQSAHHSSCGHQPNFAALNREHHLYLPGRPSRWASAHILVLSCPVIFSSSHAELEPRGRFYGPNDVVLPNDGPSLG